MGQTPPPLPASRRSFLTTAAAAGAALVSAPALAAVRATAVWEDPLLAMIQACQEADAAYNAGYDSLCEIRDADARRAAEDRLETETIGRAYDALKTPPAPTTLQGAMAAMAFIRDCEVEGVDLEVSALMDALLAFFGRQGGEMQ